MTTDPRPDADADADADPRPDADPSPPVAPAADPPPASRRPFWTTAILAFVLALTALLLLPRGGAATQVAAGEGVDVELADGVTARLVPELRDLGWRAASSNRQYSLDLQLTVANDSDALLPRWYRIEVFEQGAVIEGEELGERHPGNLQTAHIPAGGQASTDFSFAFDRPCGQFVARIAFDLTLEGRDDRQEVDVPFTVGDGECLAESG
ncbi:MAG: hypothetical protein ACTHXO_11760 [Actinomycetaceae bacterium]